MRTLDGDRVTQDVAAWVSDTRRALPSGADARAQACPALMTRPHRGCPPPRAAAPRPPKPAIDGKTGNRLPTPATAPQNC
ncbi:hypothetical protein GAY28_29650 [Azospirillum brasilense]|nr:hypothetical protein [Azospirillum brasilense]